MNSMIWGWKADIICLQETKLKGNVIEVAKKVWEADGSDKHT